MKPQQFDDMIFSDEKLSEEEKRALEAHMKTNPELLRLYKSWGNLKPRLAESEMLAPRPGFTRRWQTRWAHEQAQATRRRAILAASLFGGLALLILAIYIQPSLPSLDETKNIFVSFLNQVAAWLALLRISTDVANSLLGKLPGPAWAALSAAILGLPLAWLALYREFALNKGTIL
ncbi:MAG: hypothetical protein DWG76_03940 [Chloroflexi bacterium]|nr:hypothetical protein [Chloroflexota bacterium]